MAPAEHLMILFSIILLENRHRLFGFLSLYTAVVWLQALLFGWFQTPGQHVAVGVSLLILGVLLRSRSILTHSILVLGIAISFVVAVVLFYMRLG